MEYGQSLISVSVANGPGRTASQLPHGENGGHGLGGMRDRALSVGGLLTAVPLDDGGFVVTAQLPNTVVGIGEPTYGTAVG